MLCNVTERMDQCATCHSSTSMSECDKCVRLRKYEIISGSSQLALKYRKLISWLVRIPFTRLKAFSQFREEINNEMKSYLRLLKKTNLAEKYIKEISIKVSITYGVVCIQSGSLFFCH